jgi:hypothetical protein
MKIVFDLKAYKVLARIFSSATILLLFLAANWPELREMRSNTSCSEESADTKGFNLPNYYRRLSKLLRIRANKVSKDFVLVVLHERQSGIPRETFQDECSYRLYLAKIIQNLSQTTPKLIVVNRSFDPSACGTETSLENTLGQTQVPVAIGTAVDEFFLSQTSSLHACVALKKRSWEPSIPEGRVKFGLTRLHQNLDRIPVGLNVYDPVSGRADWTPGLALVAASFITSDIDKKYKNTGDGQHPFVARSMKDLRYMTLDGPTILKIGEIRDEASKLLRDKIIIIGDDDFRESEDKAHYLTAVIQAWYIQALIDDQYLAPASSTPFVTLYVIWLLSTQFFFWSFHSIERAALVSAFTGFCLLIVPLMFGLYATGWKTGACALCVLVKYAETRGHAVFHSLLANS